jgi:hypothetical protein
LPLAVLEALLETLWQQAKGDADTTRFHGHRLFYTDGSSASMPDTPELWRHFGGPKTKPGCGFPMLKFLLLFDSATGMIRHVLIQPYRTHDLPGCRRFHPLLEPGDLLVGDRAFGSYAHLAALVAQGLQGLFRLHQRLQVRFDALDIRSAQRLGRVRRLGTNDQLARYAKPAQGPTSLSSAEYAALPATLLLREIRYRLEAPGFRTQAVTLITTLTDTQLYPAPELAALYGRRWQIEVYFRHLKTTLKMAVLKGKSPEMVQRELLAYLLVFNLVQLVIHEAARRQGVAPERISFIDTVRWLLTAAPGDDIPELLVVPHRPGRYQPRVRKRRRCAISA